MVNMEDATNSFLGEICFQHVLVMQVSFVLNKWRKLTVHEIINFIFIIRLIPNFIPIGYRGWGCTDDREATSEIDLLAATLLLCLSNLLFLPAVGLAIYRGFYTESFVYFANMVFSTVSFDVTLPIQSYTNILFKLFHVATFLFLYLNLY